MKVIQNEKPVHVNYNMRLYTNGKWIDGGIIGYTVCISLNIYSD